LLIGFAGQQAAARHWHRAPQPVEVIEPFEVPLPPPRPPEFRAPEFHQSFDEPEEPPLPPARPSAEELKASRVLSREAYGPPMPEPFGPPMPEVFGPDLPTPETIKEAETCQALLASDLLVAKSEPPVSGPGGCGIAEPVRIEAIILKDGTHLPMQPSTLVTCTLAKALGEWIRDDLAPAAQHAGSPIKTILGSDGYECRGRNRIAGAKLSEHGKGTAFDLLGVELTDHRRLLVEHQAEAREFMDTLKTSACARFHTVLGPGSDGFHETHVHVDLAERRSDYRICHWELK